MVIGFIGGGKVGFSLGKYFSENRVKISGYYSRTERSAYEAAKFTNSRAYYNLNDLVNNSDAIFITVSDDSIYEVWQEISVLNIKNKIICHTSGSLSSKIFSNIDKSGAFGYSIHPMFPFCDKYNSYKKLKRAYFSIEGSEKYLNFLSSFFEKLGNKVLLIDGSKKALYHLANVTVSNLILSLISIGCDFLELCNINEEDAINAFMPLIKSNIENLKQKGIIESITGPVERGDVGTIKHHLEVIPYKDRQVYKDLSLNLLKLSKLKNPNKDYEELKKYLEGF